MTTPKATFACLSLIAAVCVGFTLGLTAPVWAGFDEGVAAYKRGDYATALSEFRPLAEQGNSEAQFKLGLMYGKGEGVPQDYAEAVRWYRMAAKQGNASARLNLGIMYAMGDHVPQDYAEGVRWYRMAAEQGLPEAQFNLGNMYVAGLGVPQDYVQAHMWLNLAASRFPTGETRDIVGMRRDIIAKRMTPAQISEAQKLAREWRPK